VPDKWADAEVQAVVYGTDVVVQAEDLCQEEGLVAKL
jgi:salicylate hydroxylase